MNEDRHAVVTAVAGQSFEQAILPHLEAAHRLARWHTRNPHDADDVVQEASLRALRYFGTFAGGNSRAWFLRIVRNACIDWRGRRGRAAIDSFDEAEHSGELPACNPETSLLDADVALSITRAMHQLPDRLRQVLILRELDGLSYRELADVINVPPGTVKSRTHHALERLPPFRRIRPEQFREALDVQG